MKASQLITLQLIRENLAKISKALITVSSIIKVFNTITVSQRQASQQGIRTTLRCMQWTRCQMEIISHTQKETIQDLTINRSRSQHNPAETNFLISCKVIRYKSLMLLLSSRLKRRRLMRVAKSKVEKTYLHLISSQVIDKCLNM